MDETNSNMLHYGFSSLDEEIAKDQMDAAAEQEANTTASLENSSNASNGALQNVDPSSVLNITAQTVAAQPSQDSETIPAASIVVPATGLVVPVTSTGALLNPSPAPTKPQPPAPSRSRKRKSAKGLKDEMAPKQPPTGYVMYMNERRDVIKQEYPSITFAQLTKKIAAEWTNMDPVSKKRYLEIAEVNKAKYAEEMAAYQLTDAYKTFQKKKKLETESSSTATKAAPAPEVTTTQKRETQTRLPGLEVPIFTEEFLDHNKAREKELRELRKLNTQYEEQNAILSKHVEQLRGMEKQLEEEADMQRNNNIALVQHLESLRQTLATNFVGIPLPDTNEAPTVETIDNYMAKLHQIILESPHQNDSLILAVREVVNKLNLDAYVT